MAYTKDITTTTKTKTIPISGASLTSVWSSTDKTFQSGGPTLAKSNIQNVKLGIPEGAKNVKAEVVATASSANTGKSIFSVNGNPLNNIGKLAEGISHAGETVKAAIGIITKSNTVDVQYEFKANGSTTDQPSGSSTVSITDAVLKVQYDVESKPSPKKVEPLYPIPPQSCCIYSDGKVYMFDGVIRIQHNISTKVDEEPNAEKYTYVNNATNDPDKITLDVMMSDVYMGGGAIEGQPEYSSAQNTALSAAKDSGVSTERSRSSNAYGILKQMKEDRKYVSVITPQYVYVDMMITSLVVNQDETCPYGWSGQIVFQSKGTQINPGYSSRSKASNKGSAEPTPSFVSNLGNDGKNKGGSGNFWTNTFNTISTLGKQVGVVKGGG